MKKTILFLAGLLPVWLLAQSHAQDSCQSYWAVEVDLLQPLAIQGYDLTGGLVANKHYFHLTLGTHHTVQEADNDQFADFNDVTRFHGMVGYDYFFKAKQKGWYVGANLDLADRAIESKKSDETIHALAVRPGAWVGFLWMPFKKANFTVNFVLLHPRYVVGSVNSVYFPSVNKIYTPDSFNFIGPIKLGWRF